MVLAEAEELDILHDDHLVIGHAERRTIQDMIQVQVVTAGQILERFLETLRRFAQPFPIVIQQNFFGWLGHRWFPSTLSPAYSKLLFAVSWTRMRSSFALGKDLRR